MVSSEFNPIEAERLGALLAAEKIRVRDAYTVERGDGIFLCAQFLWDGDGQQPRPTLGYWEAAITPGVDLEGLLAAIQKNNPKLEVVNHALANEEGLAATQPNTWMAQLLYTLAPWLLIIGLFWFFLMRQMRSSGGGGVLSFGRSRAQMVTKERSTVTFEDVAGIDEAKEEVFEIIEFLKNPARFSRLGGRIPRGVLLVGPPGTGKTLLAKAIAGEANVPFYSISGSDFVEMFVGVGASRVRDLFRQAREHSPCLIFLDEIDAVGRTRGSGLGGGHDEREQTLNAILVEMDGFETDEGIILVAATNRPDVLDPALLRPGRFDRQISVTLPDVKGREAILAVHTKRVKVSPGIKLTLLARATPGFSGAELAAMVNEAALIATLRNREHVELQDFEEARDKVRWGRQKKNRVMEEKDRRVTAIHEAGHAVVAHLLPEVEPLHKVTIIPRGLSLGATMVLPEQDRYNENRTEILGIITFAYGGRCAEELFCEDVSIGAYDDIKRATELSRQMVCQWGMSENIGPIAYSETSDAIFLGQDLMRQKNHSESMALEIDKEIKRILIECHDRAKRILSGNREVLQMVADALMKYETLTGAEVAAIAGGQDIDQLKREEQERERAENAQNAARTEERLRGQPRAQGEAGLEDFGGAQPEPA
ncbi:MAG: ATP-dependent zinc metalloprotease FtsH [Planctomycetes bacterium]|nr:ATP-dependent zinc metalloprotease FtsH [Planctomycetota bacterium]